MKTSQKGFTLVEMIVAIALFAVVMLVAVGALLSLTGAHRKAQALQTVMNNLNISLDGMVRNIRMGTEYNCVGGTSTGLNTANCPSSPGGKVFTFTCNPQTSACIASGNRWSYAFDDGSSSNRCVARWFVTSAKPSRLMQLTSASAARHSAIGQPSRASWAGS